MDRLMARLGRALLRAWVPFLLAVGLLSVVSASMREARWVEEMPDIGGSLALAALFGWMLAVSRFKGWVAPLYSLVISAAAAIQLAGRILPPAADLLSQPAWALVDELNLRATVFSLRVAEWAGAVQTNSRLEDTGLFVFLAGLLLWLAVLWLLWFLIRRRAALAGLLPLTVLVSVNHHLSSQPLTLYAAYLALSVLLAAYSAYQRSHAGWKARGIDYPEQLGIEWSLSALLVTLVVVLSARAAPLFGTPEGLRAVADWLRRPQDRAEETTSRLFAGVNTPSAPRGIELPKVRVLQPGLGEIGGSQPMGEDLVMEVRTSDPSPLPQGGPEGYTLKRHYYRGSIFGAYTGRGWDELALEPGAAQSPREGGEPGAGRYWLTQNYVISAQHGGRVFSVNDPVRAEGAVVQQVAGQQGGLLEGDVSEYRVVSAAVKASAADLAASSTAYPEDIRAVYLQLPAALPERVRALARRVTAPAADPYHKAVLVQNYLRQNYPYDLTVPPAPPGKDVVDDFLFDHPAGYCSHYASAMVVMLRSQGIPARVAAGYATGSWDASAGAYRVTVSDAHAWVEVYFSGYGWVEFEPTAYRSPVVYPDDPLPPAFDAPVGPAEAPRRAGWLPVALAALATTALAAAGGGLLRFFGSSRGDASAQAEVLYAQMRRALDWAGLAADGATTPNEFERAARPALAGSPAVALALRQATGLYDRSVYSPRPPEPESIQSALRVWRKALVEWLMLGFRRRWQKMRARIRR